MDRGESFDAREREAEWLDPVDDPAVELGKELAASEETLGARIRRFRGEQNLTLADVGLKVGVTPAALSKWENGKARPRAAYVPALARALGVTIPDLLNAARPGWAPKVRRESETLALADVMAECKQRIAAAAGTSIAAIRIVIEV